MRHPSLSILTEHAMVFWGIVLFALSVRAGCILFLHYYPNATQPTSLDASSYHQIAQNLVERHMFTSSVDPPYDPYQPSTFRPPLTSFYLAAIYSLFGANLFWGCLGLAVFSAFSCGLTYQLGRKLLGKSIGILAGSISCVYPFFLLLVLLPLTEGLSIFLSLILMMMLYAYQPTLHDCDGTQPYQEHVICGVYVGFVFGLLLLNKAANIVVFPCILLWGLLLSPGAWMVRVSRMLLIAITTIVMITPWAIRNQTIVGAFTPVNSNGGWTFYLGNNEHTRKNLDALEQGTSHGWIPPKDVYKPFADLDFRDVKNYEKRAIRLGLQFIRENPGTFILYAFRKLKIFWSPYQHIVDKMAWYPLALFSMLGLGYSLQCWREHLVLYVFILCSMIIPVFFTSMPRFRAPIMPFLIIYAAFGLVKAGQAIGLKIENANRY